MKFGLMYETQSPLVDGEVDEKALIENTIEQWVLADELGYDYIWLVEHHFLDTFSVSSSPDILYGAASRLTKNIRLGFGVVVLPQHHPVRIAEKIAMVDQLSNGRVDFGTGRGGAYEQVGLNVDPRLSRSMWEEAINMIPKMWEKGEFSWEGKHWNIPPRNVIPKPFQKPHPPMWLAGMQPETYRIAAEKGLGVLSLSTGAPAEMAPYIKEYKNNIRNANPVGNFVNDQWAHLAISHCGVDDKLAKDTAVNALKSFFGPDRPYTMGEGDIYKQLIKAWGGVPDHLRNQFKWVLKEEESVTDSIEVTETSVKPSGIDHFDSETLSDRGVIIAGDPDSCIKGVKIHQEAGEDQVLLLMQLDTIPHEEVISSIKTFGTEVMPEFKSD
ncbi:MAG: Flavin-dependent oxidoreductase, luciferase family [Chloroflexi bacterium]|jgi:alkanesulfonate monooxygenase SsuD/methylene tetrahydromethanopterin reductase-like flavin-dependent oxidoreductase (luciferase family)|nr:MAG: Flavin-dependent oxidoreductase, luciferase family [Chloroflexota bacterium]